jgi:hypothetical protein
MNPEQIFTNQALISPETAVIMEQNQIQELSNALKEMIEKRFSALKKSKFRSTAAKLSSKLFRPAD